MPCKAEEESGLAPADDENAAGRKISRKDIYFLMGEQYKYVKTSGSNVKDTLHFRQSAGGADAF